MNKLPSKFSISVDTREQKPLFQAGPGDDNISEYISEIVVGGDYTIREIPNLIIIERKADSAEVFSSMILNKERFQRQIDKMMAYKHRYIIIQQSYKDFIDPAKWTFMKNYKDRIRYIATCESWLFSLQYRYNIHCVFIDSAQSARFVRKLLIKFYEYSKKESNAKA